MQKLLKNEYVRKFEGQNLQDVYWTAQAGEKTEQKVLARS
jgi:hypothetical protein